MTTIDTIVTLIDAAKRLKAIAEKTGDVELKAQILDVTVQLLEIREKVFADEPEPPPEDTAELASAAEESSTDVPVTPPRPDSTESGDSQPARIERSGEIETYTLHFPILEPPADVGEPEEGDASESDDGPRKKKGSRRKGEKANTARSPSGDSPGGEADAESASELTEEERFALAEQRIAELEPLHQAALKKMNDVLTDEQAARKVKATKSGVAAGLRGKQLQDAVFAALDLTEEQQRLIAEGKHDLHQVRLAIGKQVEGLLSREQLDRLLRSHRH